MTFLMHAAATGLGSGVSPSEALGLTQGGEEPLLPLTTPSANEGKGQGGGDGEDKEGAADGEVGGEVLGMERVGSKAPDPWIPMVKLAFAYAKANVFRPEVRASLTTHAT